MSKMDDNRSQSLLEEFSASKATELIPIDIFIGLLIVFGLSGNVFVLLFYSRKPASSPTTKLILMVAMNDVVVCVLMPKNLLLLLYPYNFKYNYLCKADIFINHVTSYLSVLILFIIAIFRYRGICKPFAPAYTVKHANRSIVAACIVSFILSSPTLIVYETLPLNITSETNHTFQGYDCVFNNGQSLQIIWMMTNIMDSAMIVMTGICFIVVYWRVGMAIAKHKKTRDYLIKNNKKELVSDGGPCKDMPKKDISSVSGQLSKDACKIKILGHGSSPEKREKGESTKNITDQKESGILSKSAIQQTPMLIAITVIHMVSFLPFIIISVHRSLSKEIVDELTVSYQLGSESYLINNATNPYVYLLFNKSFRQFVNRMLCSCGCAKNPFSMTNP